MFKLRYSLVFYFLFWVLCIISAQNPNGYYNSASGKKKEQLKTALHQIVRNHTVLDYGSLWMVFRQTDQRPDGTVWDMYSNIVRTYSSSGLNREHSFPKSWWGGDVNAAYTDINHLYPSDATANSAKSNYPLGVVGSNPSFNNGVSKVGSNAFPGYSGVVFEPHDQYKGDFARAYFYIVTCYQDYYNKWAYLYMVDNNTYPVLKPWSVNLLLQWHRNDPVSQKELDRNEAVFRIQNNRNPFIDYPDLAEHIWGNKMEQEFVINTTITEPVLVTPTNDTRLEFGTVLVNQSSTKTLYVKGINLTGQNLTAILYGADASQFSINTTAIPVNQANSQDGYQLKITYSPKTVSAEHQAAIIIYDGGVNGSVLVNITGRCISPGSLEPPIALNASYITNNSFKANWQESDGTDYYILNVYTWNGNEPVLYLSEDDINALSYDVTGLEPGQKYSYHVNRSVNEQITDPSNTIVVYTHTSLNNPNRNEAISMFTSDKIISINNDSNISQWVEIYNSIGTLLWRSEGFTGQISVPVTAAGVYVVNAGGDIRKVVVR